MPGVEPPRFERLVALDLMRGLVMVLMALDHSSDAFNGGRLITDSAAFFTPGTPLPAAQFLTRWVTHLCAPTFVFLAGTGLAFSVKNELSRGKSQLSVDRYLLVRGVIIVGFELWVSYFLMSPGKYLFQVLYAIGTSYLLMIPLRRLKAPAALALSLGLMLTLELAGAAFGGPAPKSAPLGVTLLILGGRLGPLFVAYPTLPWLSIMLLGWAFGNHLLARPQAPSELSRRLALTGLVSLALFAVIRGVDGYGNMWLHREGWSLVQWLHVSKYPPGLAYLTLELGLCFLGLAVFMAFFSGSRAPSRHHVLFVLGQTPMFFYLLHFPLLMESAKLFGVEKRLGLAGAYLGAALAVLLLYPACRAYRSYKLAHRDGWPRYI